MVNKALVTPHCDDTGREVIYKKILNECAGLSEDLIQAHFIRAYFNRRAIRIGERELLAGTICLTDATEFKETATGPNTPAPGPAPWQNIEGKELLWAWAGNHGTADFEHIIQYGFQDYKNRILKCLEDGDNEYLQALLMVCDAVADLSRRYSEECLRLAKAETDVQRRDELLKLAEACKKVPEHPAQNFYEAIQSYWFSFYLFGDGVGRADQYLCPYYKKDIESGRITKEEALELVECFYIKIFEVRGSDRPRSADNHLTVSGTLPDGEGGYNEMTELFLTTLGELKLWRPQITFRWYPSLPDEDFRKAVRVHTKRYDRLMFINDEVMIRGLRGLGVDHKDAVNYSLSGCNEVIVTGKSHMGSVEGFLNLLKPLEILLGLEENQSFARICNNDDLARISRYGEFFDLFKRQLELDVGIIFDLSYLVDRERAKTTNLLQSLPIEGCIENRKSYSGGGAKYNFCNWCAIGLINLVDSLSVIRQFVFEEKIMTLPHLVKVLKCNWDSFENLRLQILNGGRFFGNDDDFADEIAIEVVNVLHDLAGKRTPFRGGAYNFGTLAGIENMHVNFGKTTGATPDGRHAGDSFEASIGASKDKNGVLATLKSVAKIDFTKLPCSVVVNIKLDKSIGTGEENINRIAALITTFFKLGGVHLQINFLSSEDLRRAQQKPEEYAHLRVRVTGYSGFFTQLDEALQNEIIARTEHRL